MSQVEEYKIKLEAAQSSQKGELESWQAEKAALLEKISNLEAETLGLGSELKEKKTTISQLVGIEIK